MWRYKISVTLSSIVIITILYALLVDGFFPFVSLGYAKTADLQELQGLWKQVRKDQLDSKLFETRERQCAAIVSGNKSALESETRRLQDNLVDYRNATGSDWRIPGCYEY